MRNTPVKHRFSRLFEKSPDEVCSNILVSYADPPSSRRNASVQGLCSITWSNRINVDTLPTDMNPVGKVFGELEYEIEMTNENGTVDFVVLFNDKRVGGRNVDVDYS
jgi:hypothetical protein